MTHSQPFIRRATINDTPSLNRICFLTADAGNPGEDIYACHDLPGALWADPYVNLPSGTGFVLVDPSLKSPSPPPLDTHTPKTEITSDEGTIVGYIVTAYDVPSFERELEESWFPQYRKKYPLSREPLADGSPIRKEGDIKIIDWIHDDDHEPYHADAASLALSPADMHIDILPGYQGQGWGRTLIGTMVNFLKEEKGLDALWLALDPRNEKARRFYEHLGYKPIEGAPDRVLGLRFSDWRAPPL